MNWETIEADVNKLITKHFTKGRSGKSINKVIVHHNAGKLSIDDCWNVWQNCEQSAHYQVDNDGRIGQLVWDADTAWHAGNWDANLTSIGVEHANDGGAGWTISEKCLDSGAHLVAALCKYYKLGRPEWLRNVYPHSHFSATACPGAIYGSQKDAYIKRAQYWYDVMTGAVTENSEKEEEIMDMKEMARNVWGYVNERLEKVDAYQILRDIRDMVAEIRDDVREIKSSR